MNNKASISAQAAALKKSIQNREQRRAADKVQRYAAAEASGEYGDQEAAARRHAPVAGASQVQRLAEISAMSAARQVETFRCDLCQATFNSEAQHQQHLMGPVHRKAVEKRDADRLLKERRAKYQDMTESALGAAAWQAGQGQQPAARAAAPPQHHGSGTSAGGAAATGSAQPAGAHATSTVGQQPRGGAQHAAGMSGRGFGQQQQQQQGAVGPMGQGGRGGTGRGQPQQQQQEGRGPGGDGGGRSRKGDVLSHSEMVAMASKRDEPLTIDGWAPPTITLPPPAAPAPKHPQRSLAEPVQREAAVGGVPGAQAQAPAEGAGGASDGSDGKEGAEAGGLLGLVGYGSDGEEGEGGEGGGGSSGSESSSSEGGDGLAGGTFTGAFF